MNVSKWLYSLHQRLDKCKILPNYIHSLPCIGLLCGCNKLPQLWRLITMPICHPLWMSDSTGRRPPGRCRSVSSAGSPFPHVPDLPWCSIHSKHKLFVLFQVPLPTLWPPVTHGPARDGHRVGKGRAIQSVRNVRSRLHKPAAKVFRWAVWTAWNGQWWWGAHWAWGPLRVYCWSSSEPKPWLIHQRGL